MVISELRFVERDGKKILQMLPVTLKVGASNNLYVHSTGVWHDVPLDENKAVSKP